jgi:hypothetical protein
VWRDYDDSPDGLAPGGGSAISHREEHENSTLQVRVFLLLLAAGTSGGAISLLVWAANQRNPVLIVFGLLSVGMSVTMIYGATLVCGRSDGTAMHAAARRRARVPAPRPAAPVVGYRPPPPRVIVTRR